MTWNPAEFEDWFRKECDLERRRRALDDLTGTQRKLRREYLTFSSFAPAAGLDVDPRSIQNRETPEPDILCKVSGLGHYFELGELTDEAIPKDEARVRKAGGGVYGGAISPTSSLEKMVFGKCSKTYDSKGLPVDLLLYYAVGHQAPHPGVLTAWLSEHRKRINAALEESAFRAIWFFDEWQVEVLEVITRSA